MGRFREHPIDEHSLRDPLPVDLDGDGKAEVIVPDEHGAIAVLDGPSGQLRWRSEVAFDPHRDPSAARVLVGPDLDGDGYRDLFVANVVGFGGRYGYPHVRAQALSGKTGQPLWRCRFRIPETDGHSRFWDTNLSLFTWGQGRDGWPMLVVPGLDRSPTLVVESGTGRVAHVIPGFGGPFRVIDLDGDGSPELVVFQVPGDGPGRLQRFRGTSLEMVAGWPVTPQEEPVEWVRFPWVERITTTLRDVSLIALALVFLAYVGLRVLRKGWRGLWLPVIADVVFLIVVIIEELNRYRDSFEPWQRYCWDGWYWTLFYALFLGGILTLWWLGILLVFRLLRCLFRLVFRRRASVEIGTTMKGATAGALG
jgi:hypothetical protein